MTDQTDRIKQMAQEAGLLPCHEVYAEDLAKFAALVAEDCAQHVERKMTEGRSPMGRATADFIRARYGLKGE